VDPDVPLLRGPQGGPTLASKRHPGRRKVALALAGLAVLAAGAGGWPLARWVNERRIEARIDAYSDLIWREAEASALPPDLVQAVIRAESRGLAGAVSSAGAKGLMQITPPAEREARDLLGLSEGDLFDPEYNIRIGTVYLRRLVERFGGDLHLTLAAYHWGPTRVQTLRDEHPGLSGQELVERHGPRATARYCREVLGGRALVLPSL